MPTHDRPPLEGAWQLQQYVVDGRPTPIDGLLLFAGQRWSTVFFVPAGAEWWGSAEAGEYAVDGASLIFTHRYTFQGGGDRTLVMNPANDRVEPCGVTLSDAALTITFPSGNLLHCRRVAS
jgi:hypothetical protein